MRGSAIAVRAWWNNTARRSASTCARSLSSSKAACDLGQPAAAAEDQQREPTLLAGGKSGHVGVLQDVRTVLVEADVRHRHPDLVQRGSPLQQRHVAGMRAGQRAAVQTGGQRGDAGGMGAIDRVAVDEALHRDAADVRVDGAAEQIVEDTEAQRATHRIDALDL